MTSKIPNGQILPMLGLRPIFPMKMRREYLLEGDD